MNIAKYIFIVGFFVTSSTSFAQNVLRLEILGGVSFNSTTAGVFSNWGNGWTIGAGGAYRVGTAIDLIANAVYHRYPFHGDNLQLVFPAIEGLRWSVSGQASTVIEGSIAARFSISNSFINPFLSLRTGLFFMNTGSVVVSEWFDSNPQDVSHSTYNGTGVSTTKGFAAIGLGFSIPLDVGIRVIIEGRFTETFDAKEFFLPMQATVQIDI
jgi:hypothetical protein